MEWIADHLAAGGAPARTEVGNAAVESSIISADLRDVDVRSWIPRLLPLLERVSAGVLAVGADSVDDGRAGLLEAGMSVPFSGMAPADGEASPSGLLVAESSRYGWSTSATPPDSFDVVAFVIVYNEEDILEAALTDLTRQGVSAYVIDNWSTDRSYEIARSLRGNGVVGLEKYPSDGPPKYFDLRALLERIEVLAESLDADWYMKHDADEFRRAPWEGVTLREGLYTAQRAGFNCVDFTVLNFEPVDNGFRRGVDPLEHFKYFDFGRKPGHFRQMKAWRNTGEPIEYASMGSHRIRFPGLRVFPYKFLLRHYPVRSQGHGERKVFQERQERFLPEAKKRGWHSHYDAIRKGHNFLSDPDDLIEWDEAEFNGRYLAERLSGVGIEREEPDLSAPGVG